MKVLELGMGWFPEQPGGLNRYFYDSTQYLSLGGLELKGLVTGSDSIAKNTNGLINSFAPTNSSIFQRFQGIRHGLKTINYQNYSLIASHFSLYTFPALDIIKNKPLICHFHGPWAREGSFEGNKSISSYLKIFIEKTVYRQAKAFIVLSQAFAKVLHQEYNIPLNLIHVIPGGVNLHRYQQPITKADARIQLGWNSNNSIIFVVRRLAKRMGLENLINAIAKVRKTHPEILLLIAGKGYLKENLQAQIDQLQLNNNVKLLGYLPDDTLPVAYKAADFSIVPTVDLEGFGLILLESLASGTPVLGTPVGGIPEVLKPLSEHLLFNGTTCEDLTEGIFQVLNHQRILPNAEACQAYVQANYNWTAIAQQIKTIYQSVL